MQKQAHCPGCGCPPFGEMHGRYHQLCQFVRQRQADAAAHVRVVVKNSMYAIRKTGEPIMPEPIVKCDDEHGG